MLPPALRHESALPDERRRDWGFRRVHGGMVDRLKRAIGFALLVRLGHGLRPSSTAARAPPAFAACLTCLLSCELVRCAPHVRCLTALAPRFPRLFRCKLVRGPLGVGSLAAL